MGARQVGAAAAHPLETVIRSITALADRIARLEGTVSNQALPPDVRFQREVDPVTGELSVYLVRVSTGNREKIAGPL